MVPPDPLMMPYDRGWYRGLIFLSTTMCAMLQYLFLWGCTIAHSALKTTTLATIDVLDLLIVAETTQANPRRYRRTYPRTRKAGDIKMVGGIIILVLSGVVRES